jgi:hypothetical protein
MNLTCSRSIALILPAATSRSSSSVFIREIASSSSICHHETYAKYVLTLCSEGNLRTITLKAFPEETYRTIIAALA